LGNRARDAELLEEESCTIGGVEPKNKNRGGEKGGGLGKATKNNGNFVGQRKREKRGREFPGVQKVKIQGSLEKKIKIKT